MSITDELRKYTESDCSRCGGRKDLLDIADRIDAEYKKALHDAIHNALANGAKSELRQIADTHIALPVDADGVPIHVGDIMVYEDYTKPMEVIAFAPPNVLWMEEGARFADMCRHYHEPPIEGTLIKMLEEAVGYSAAHTLAAHNAVSKYTEKLKEMMDDE